MFIYKIQDRKTKKFSMGGHWVSFSKEGKSWRLISHLMHHIKQCTHYHFKKSYKLYKNSDVVKYKLVEVDRYSLRDYIDKEFELK